MESTLAQKMGLANMGNTCFLNVVLQSLRLTPPLGTLFLKNAIKIRKKSKKTELVEAFQTLFTDFWKNHPSNGNTPVMTPRGFYRSFLNVLQENEDTWYSQGHQCCAGEAVQYMLDSLHDGMYKKVTMDISGCPSSREESSHMKALQSWSTFFTKEYSPIVEHFYGQTQISVQCNSCNNISERYEPWIVKELSIPGGDVVGGTVPTMEECLKHNFSSEILDDYQCDNCKTRGKATKTDRISRLPPITILHLKRFTNSQQKVCGKVTWDLDSLDFSSVMAFRRDPFLDCHRVSGYETYAVIEHLGSFHGGHYAMFGKQCGTWYEYDDSSVMEVAPDRVVSANSYILFLMRTNMADDMRKSFAKQIQELRSDSR